MAGLLVTSKFGEVPAGAVDNTNTIFTLSKAPLPYCLDLYKNGIWQTPGVDYTYLQTKITMTVAPVVVDGIEDKFYAQYTF